MKEFKIENLLEKHVSLKEGIFLETSRVQTDIFSLRAISATNQNHGAGFFVKPDDHDVLNDMLSMSANGANSGFVAYQSLPFAIAQDSYAMELKNNLASCCIAKYIYLYLSAAISKYSLLIYGYQNKAGWERFKESFVSLPVQSLSDAEPDWAYMEEYMKDIEKKTISKVKEENDREIARLNELVGMDAVKCLEEVEYAEFRLEDLFELERGFRHIKSERVSGNTPYYSTSDSNNGLTDMISNPKHIFKGNSLILTTFGYAYHIPHDFAASDEITVLRNKNINKRTALYLATKLNKFSNQFSYSYKAFTGTIKKLKVSLPVKSLNDTEPDWAYMENYVLTIELSLRSRIKDCL